MAGELEVRSSKAIEILKFNKKNEIKIEQKLIRNNRRIDKNCNQSRENKLESHSSRFRKAQYRSFMAPYSAEGIYQGVEAIMRMKETSREWIESKTMLYWKECKRERSNSLRRYLHGTHTCCLPCSR